MTDLSPDFDFTAAANAAIDAGDAEAAEGTPVVEDAPVEEAPAVEPAAEETPAADEQPRDEAGRFASTEEPPADVSVELEALRKRLADKDEFIDRQGNEIGDLRKAFEERFDSLTEQVNKPAAQRVGLDNIVDGESAAAAVHAAWGQGDEATAAAAYREWKEYDPAAAGAWAAYTASQREMDARDASIREAYEQRIAGIEARLTPVTRANTEQERAAQVRQLTAEIPADDLNTFLNSDALAALANEFSWAAEGLASDRPAEQVATIKSLYLVHRGRTADTLTRTAQDVARETAESAAQATADAYVASAATATSTTSVQKTEAEEIADNLAARFTQRHTVWNDGWERT